MARIRQFKKGGQYSFPPMHASSSSKTKPTSSEKTLDFNEGKHNLDENNSIDTSQAATSNNVSGVSVVMQVGNEHLHNKNDSNATTQTLAIDELGTDNSLDLKPSSASKVSCHGDSKQLQVRHDLTTTFDTSSSNHNQKTVLDNLSSPTSKPESTSAVNEKAKPLELTTDGKSDGEKP